MHPTHSPPRIGVTAAPARRRNSRAGFTLIQLMIVIAIASMAIYFMTTILMNAQNAFSTGVTVETAQGNAVRTANGIAAELKDAVLSSVYACSYCKNHISFQKNLGHDPVTGAVQRSTWIYYWYQWNYTGTGYTDWTGSTTGEGKIVRWQDGVTTTVGQSVKATSPETGLPGFCVTQNGTAFTVSVTVEVKDNRDKPIRYTATTSACPFTQ